MFELILLLYHFLRLCGNNFHVACYKSWQGFYIHMAADLI